MHFNTKYIFKGDSESEMIEKLNHNFNQIISFAGGQRGLRGPKGPQGFPGGSGRKGQTGPTGQRATLFINQNVQPATGDYLPYDYWIDSSSSTYKVYSYGTTGGPDWAYSGFSLFSSPYLDVFNNILGPGGADEKNAIGFKSGSGFLVNNGLTVSDASLVISDSTLTSLSNPNRSKLVISTIDQITRPILSFSKTGASSSGAPSFYWTNTGNSTDLTFRSNGGLKISSLLGLVIDSFTASSILNGNQINLTSSDTITIGGTGDFYLFSNTTVGVGSNFLINSTNLNLTSSSFNFKGPLKITNTSGTSGYVFDLIKNSSSSLSTSGIEIYSGSLTTSFFEFRDSNNANLFSTKVKGSVNSPEYGQTNFGSTGGLTAGGTAGPYLYHVKRSVEYRGGTYSQACFGASSTYATVSSSLPSGTINNIFDLSVPNLWTSDTIIITPTSYTNSSNSSVYIKVPSSILSTLPGLYYSGTSNNYRLILNDLSAIPNYSLKGLVLDYFLFSGGFTYSTSSTVYVDFNSGNSCYFVDLFFSSAASNFNPNPRIFWKTCDGKSGYITTTNKYTVGSLTVSGTTMSGSA